MLDFRKQYSGIWLIIFFLFCSCSENSQEKNFQDTEQTRVSDADLEAVNRQLLRKEIDQIEQFIRRNEWDMQVSPTGLHYQKYVSTKAVEVAQGNKVSLFITLNLLNGKQVFSSEKEGSLDFVIGKAQVPRGLEEAVLNMRKGEKMRAVLPSHLAYGLYGDGNKIPPRAVLIYDIELLNIYIAKNKNKN